MFSLKEFLSVYDDLKEDVQSLTRQSQQYQQQIQELQVKANRLLQLKMGVDKQIQQQTQSQQQQAQQSQQQAGSQVAATGTPAPQAGSPMAQPSVQ